MPDTSTAPPKKSIASPCIGVCEVSDSHGLCVGCGRNSQEIADWREGTEEWRQSIWDEIPARLVDLGVTVQRLQLDSAQILDFIEDSIRNARGTWVMGVYGGVGEFNRTEDEAYDLIRSEDTLTAITDSAAIQLSVPNAGRLLAIQPDPNAAPHAYCLAIHRSKLALPVMDSLTVLGPDKNAIREVDRTAPLFDIGLGRKTARFYIRTQETEVLKALTEAEGLTLDALLPRAGAVLLAHSPTRVIETAMGRVEVETEIPPPGGASPSGPHTHLNPVHLAQGIDTNPGLSIPGSYVVGALFYPKQGG